MAIKDIIPQKSVSMVDLRDTLNANEGNVGNDLSEFFSGSANINKWARYKPTKYNKLTFADGFEIPMQYQAENGLCGFTEGSIVFVTVEDLVTAYEEETTFIYELPTGGDKYPFRLGDFRGYLPSAKAPIWSFDYEGAIYQNDTSSSMTFNILGDGDIDSSYNLQMADLLPDGDNPLSLYKFGIIVVDSQGVVVVTKSSSSTIGTSTNFSATVVLNQADILGKTGDYKAYPMFTDLDMKKFVACPKGYISFSVKASVDAEVVGWMQGTGYWSQGALFTFGGQLAYSSNYEGKPVYIDLLVNNTSVWSDKKELVASSTSDDKTRHYMNFSHQLKRSTSANDSYMLKLSYGDELLNADYLVLVENESAVEPSTVQE